MQSELEARPIYLHRDDRNNQKNKRIMKSSIRISIQRLAVGKASILDMITQHYAFHEKEKKPPALVNTGFAAFWVSKMGL